MNVLVFTSLFPNTIWPHQCVFVKERVAALADLRACAVQVVAPVPYFPPLKINHRWLYSQVPRREVIQGLDVHHPRYVMVPKVAMALHGWFMFASLLPVIRKIRRSFDFDLIDSHYVYPDGFAAVMLGRFFRKPVVVSARGSDVNLFREFRVIRRLLRYTLSEANEIITVSQALRDAVLELGISGDKVTVIPNGVDARKFRPLPKTDARKALGLPDGNTILSVGNLTVNKGFDLLVGAFDLLQGKFEGRSLYLAIVGDGPARRQLEDMIRSRRLEARVRLVGNVAHQELYMWYSAADVFCLASEREGWPNVLLESLACGTPVVATSAGGIPEIIRSESVGLLAERNERDLAAKLSAALAKTWQPDAIVRYALDHTWNAAAKSVLRVFERSLAVHVVASPSQQPG